LITRGHEVIVATHLTPPGIPSLADLARWQRIPFVEDSPDELCDTARAFRPDIIFSVYYRTVLPADMLDLAPRGAFNFHPSLLPKHAGCFSAVWAIIDGDRTTGVTCHRMTRQVDGGDIVDTLPVPIQNTDTGMSLYYQLVDATAIVFDRVLHQAEHTPLITRPQQGVRSYHPREVPQGGAVDPYWPRDRIERFIRALYFPPYEPAHVVLDGRRHPVRNIDEYDRLLRPTHTKPEREHTLSTAPS
jgi:methionyl-tRNA formyltransferase